MNVTDILYLFPDTNLFIQCRALEELDWSPWQQFDEVHLIVSRPVLREIDYQKNKGNDRVGRRARIANGIFREMTLSGQDRTIREAQPRVRLLINVEYLHSPALEERLDYTERDDQLIGTIAMFGQKYPEADVRLLTDDGTPMATARSLGIDVVPIPESWRLPPETTESERRANALAVELARLKKTEPQFRVACVNSEGDELDRLTYTIEYFAALSEAQLSVLMERIVSRFPIMTDFGPQGEAGQMRTQPGTAAWMDLKETFVPASDKDIARYRDEHYPQWVKFCREKLSQYHDLLNGQISPPNFFVRAVNEGTRPGKDVLITFDGRGDFLISPPQYREEDEAEEQKSLTLPRPPEPPRGRWELRSRVFTPTLLKAFEEFQRVSAPVGLLPGKFLVPPVGDRSYRRDPNDFYYKPDRTSVPARTFSLECEQWRHGVERWEDFRGEIHFAKAEQMSALGALECHIHAENLSDAVMLRVPVSVVASTVSVFERAEKLVKELLA